MSGFPVLRHLRVCQHLCPLNRVMLLVYMSDNVWARFFFRSFMVSYLVFMSLNHFEFIFVSGVREYSNYYI